jgi:hypothetical protein
LLGGPATAHYFVRQMDVLSVPAEVAAAWADLEDRALEPNAYLSPHFVLPSAQHIHPNLPVEAVLVEMEREGAGARHLVAVMVAHAVMGTRSFPVPHLVTYAKPYALLGGLLLDRDHAEPALDALLDHVVERGWQGHGIELEDVWADGPTYELFQRVGKRRGMRLQIWDEKDRAVLRPHVDRDQIVAAEAAETRSLKRRIKRLSEMGEVRSAVVVGGPVPEPSVEAFLDLENRGWKGDNGSSLRAKTGYEAFFRDAVARFGAEGRALFVELLLDEQVIATTSNFISGRAGFAFKIGWQPELAHVSPGRQAELGQLHHLYSHEALAGLEFWDSGATAGSYIENLWPGRRQLVTMGVGCSLVGTSALAAVHTARAIKREVRARWGSEPSASEPPATEPPEPKPPTAG